MQIAQTQPAEFTIVGNIKTTADYLEIRRLVLEAVAAGARSLNLVIRESLSMPSAVIGFFVKLIKRDKVRVAMAVQDPRLLELLDELGLRELFGARPLA